MLIISLIALILIFVYCISWGILQIFSGELEAGLVGIYIAILSLGSFSFGIAVHGDRIFLNKKPTESG